MQDRPAFRLSFCVPPPALRALSTEIAKRPTVVERATLTAVHLDTPGRHLARAGVSWQIRREGRRWIQRLQVDAGAEAALVHEAIVPGAEPHAQAHADTPAGDRLQRVLKQAADDGAPVGPRFESRIRRVSRRIRTAGASVDVSLDEGRLVSAGTVLPVRELAIEHASGASDAALAFVQRWCRRYDLLVEPRSLAERGDRLADGTPLAPLRKAQRPHYAEQAGVTQAYGSVVDECLQQILRNVVGLHEGDPATRVDHVHQLRVGIRRLRSGLRCFDGWSRLPPEPLVERLKDLFGELGASRDSDVLDSGVAVALSEVGAPPLKARATSVAVDPVAIVRRHETQILLIGWLHWRSLLDAPVPADTTAARDDEGKGEATGPSAHADVEPEPEPETEPETATRGTPVEAVTRVDDTPLARRAEKRLGRWHRQLVEAHKQFDTLDEEALHTLRKRIKRQRYAVEFFAPVLARKAMERYLKPLSAIQDRMGELNDLYVARTHYQTLLESDPAAWFALGWLAARIRELKARAEPELGRLAKADAPRAAG